MKQLATPHPHHRRRHADRLRETNRTLPCPVPRRHPPAAYGVSNRPGSSSEFQYRFFDSDGVDFICAGVSGEPFEVTVPLDEIGGDAVPGHLGAIQYRRSPRWLGTSLVDYLPATRLKSVLAFGLFLSSWPASPRLCWKMAAGSK